MATSRIEITFNEDLLLDEVVHFEKKYNDGTIFSDWHDVTETWKTQRLAQNQVSIGFPSQIQGERSAINFVNAINLDYNFYHTQNGNQINGVTRIGNKVIIKVNKFWNFRISDPNLNSSNVTVDIFNFSANLFFIENVSYLPAVTNGTCSHYRVAVNANENITEYSVNNGSFISANSDTIYFEVLRNQNLSFLVKNAQNDENERHYTNLQVPSFFDNLNVTVNASPNGATAIAQIETNLLEVQYSLDDITYQESNVFSGLEEGNYTLYAKDNLGCKISEDFYVDEFGIIEPYFYVPKSNAIRFAHVVNWDDCSNYKTDDNTLSCQENVETPKEYTQLFQTCDIIPIQIHSGYNINTCNVIDEDDNIIEIPFTIKSNFMRRKDMRDARIFNAGNNQTGIYFISGNIYDYDTGIDTGNDYVLNGNLPEFAEVGNYFSINNIWHQIEQIKYDYDKNADVLILNSIYTGQDESVIVSSIYNVEIFEVYELSIDFSNYMDKCLRVQILAQDDNFEDIEIISEKISVKVRHKNTSLIRYKNSTNTDVYYSTGIEFKVRLEVESIYAEDEEESSVSISDTQSKIYKANIRERNVFEWSALSTEMMRKLKQILIHDTLSIDNVAYAKNDSPEVEHIKHTNLYLVTSKMLKAGKNFNSNASLGGFEFSGGNVEVPNLVDFGGGFVEY